MVQHKEGPRIWKEIGLMYSEKIIVGVLIM
jgi:hypothetical protein